MSETNHDLILGLTNPVRLYENDDIELAFAWYERQRKGLGFEFLDCMEAPVHNILNNSKKR